ncbi:MAG TPA: hypothetical protein VI233_15880, partial [Puia sp.]
MSFYYWRTTFSLDSQETHTLRDNAVDTLYVRYFDVDWPAADTAPSPLAPIRFETSPAAYTIIPVVYLRNKVFEKLTPAALPAFAGNVHTLIQRISRSRAITPREVQFDCDWTEHTKDIYFQFLRSFRTLSNQELSCTIRLHQIKFPDRTGIPPVDRGVLMYYNMGAIDARDNSSIYDKAIAHRYTPFLRSYPLTLDLALPVFAWGLKVRDGKVVQLLDKMNANLFEKDSSFRLLATNRYRATRGCFKSGYYFQAGDQVKIESVSAGDLEEIVTDVNKNTNRHIRNLIFFDLDRQNLQSYDKDIYKEILAHT